MKYLFIFALALTAACIEKKTFPIPNDYQPDYQVGDTLIFADSIGSNSKIYCSLALHEFIKDKTKEHDYTKEHYLFGFKNSKDPNIVIGEIEIGYNQMSIRIPSYGIPYYISWDSIGVKNFPRSEIIDGNTYGKVVDLISLAGKPNYYQMTYDLYKGILAYDDPDHIRWYFKELKRKL